MEELRSVSWILELAKIWFQTTFSIQLMIWKLNLIKKLTWNKHTTKTQKLTKSQEMKPAIGENLLEISSKIKNELPHDDPWGKPPKIDPKIAENGYPQLKISPSKITQKFTSKIHCTIANNAKISLNQASTLLFDAAAFSIKFSWNQVFESPNFSSKWRTNCL